MNSKFIEIFERATIPLVQKFYADIPYHNIQHVKDIFSATRCFLSVINDEYPEFDWGVYLEGVLWHDASYIPGSHTNEFTAAQQYLLNSTCNSDVVELILSTKAGNAYFRTPEQEVMHDMDYFQYLEYADLKKGSDAIIKEVYQGTIYSKEAVIENRIAFYNQLLASDKVFISKIFGPDANNRATESIKADMKRLENLL